MEIKQITKIPDEERLNLVVSSWTYNPTEDRIRERIMHHIELENLYSFSINNETIGAFAFKKINEITSEITGIGVLKDFRNNGYGRQILKEAEELICFETIFVETNDSAVGFYKKCGYLVYNTRILDNGIVRYQLSKRSL